MNESLENISIDHKVIGFCLNHDFFNKVKNILRPEMFSGQLKEIFNTVTHAHTHYEKDMTNDELFALLNARQRRSLKRGLSDNKKKLIAEIKEMKEGKSKNPIKTHQRDLIILPYMIGTTINVFDGNEFKPIGIGAEMVGHYIGEYAITNKRVNHGAPGVGASRSSLYVPLK